MTVIPAKAGIHFDLTLVCRVTIAKLPLPLRASG
jgi:hypothetical protein